MIRVSEVSKTAPEKLLTPLHRAVYDALSKLGIYFERVDTDEAITMEDCRAIGEKLGVGVVKTLFLCNRQKTAFYLFVTTEDKAFSTKAFSAALGVARVSFAPPELMEEMLGFKVGAATVFGALMDHEHSTRIVIDRDVLGSEWYGCSDGTTTGYMKVHTEDVIEKLLPYTGHTPELIEV